MNIEMNNLIVYGAAGLAAFFALAFIIAMVMIKGAKKRHFVLENETNRLKSEIENLHNLLTTKEENYTRNLADRDAANTRLLDEKDKAFAASLAEKDKACAASLAEKERVCEQRLAEKDAVLEQKDRDCKQLLADRDEQCDKRIRENNESIDKIINEKKQSFDEVVKTLQEKFTNIAAQKLDESTRGLSALTQEKLSGTIQPFREEIDRLRKSFDENRQQQVESRASFERAIYDLGKSAMQISADAENLAKALKNESKTQGDWGEMVLTNILTAAGLKEGQDFIPQAQEFDELGNKLIPDVEIPLPDNEKLLIDSKTSITAYLDYVATQDEKARENAIKEHIISVRRHMNELADKQYTKKIKGSQNYILMFIPNEGSYLLAMEQDKKLAMDAFKRHVIIVNPTTLLLCLQIVALLRSRESINENAEKIIQSASKVYDKFVGFAETFVDIGKRMDGLTGAYKKANGQLCDGKGNVVKQLESLKDMGIVSNKRINHKLLDNASNEIEDDEAEIEEAAECEMKEPPRIEVPFV